MNDSDIRNAFESIGPSPEAEKRMLEKILGANTERISAQTADASDAPRPRLAATANPRQPERTAAESASQQPRVPITKSHAHSSAPAHSKPVRKKRSPLAVALPIAACLIIVAIGVGMAAFNTSMNKNLGGSADMAALSKSESQESPPDAAIEAIPYSESPTEEPNSPSMLAALFPTIELADDSTLRVAFDDRSKPLVADIDLVGSERESATAHSDNAADESTVPCTVFEYADELHPYAIHYEGDPTYYLAASDS